MRVFGRRLRRFALTVLPTVLVMQYLFPMILESSLLFAVLVSALFVAGIVLTVVAYRIGMGGGR